MRWIGRSHKGRITGLVVLALAGCSSTADAPPPVPEGRLRVSPIGVMPAPAGQQHVSLVIAPASGSAVPRDISVFVDGQEVPADAVKSHRASASLVLLVDDSSEMEQRGLSPVADGILQALVHSVNPHADRLSAIRFSDDVTPLYDYASPPSFIKRRGLRLEPAGNRCLNVALEAAVAAAEVGPMQSGAVLLATSGENADGVCGGPDRESIIGTARSAGIPVHVVHLGPVADPKPELERLAAETAGAYWVLGTADSLDSLADEVVALLDASLYLTFRTEAAETVTAVDVRAEVDRAQAAGIVEVRPSDGGPLFTSLVAGHYPAGPRVPGAIDPGGPKAGDDTSPSSVVAAGAVSAPPNRTTLIGMVFAAGLAGTLIVLRRRRSESADTPSALAAVRARADADRLAAEDSRLALRDGELTAAGDAVPGTADGSATTEDSRAIPEPSIGPDPIAPVAPFPHPAVAPDRAWSAVERQPDSEAEPANPPADKSSPSHVPGTGRPGAAVPTAPLASVNGAAHSRPAAPEVSAPAAVAGSRRLPTVEQSAAGTIPTAHQEPAPFALIGFVCGRYRLEAPLGRGGLGEVYRARDLQFDRTVAVKVLFDTVFEGADAFDSLMREVSLVDRITHPNVVRVYDVIRFEGRVAIVMEFVSGQSLAAITRDQGTVSPEDFDPVLTGVAEALDAAHAAGVVHGDVTPGNVLITEEGKVKLCDFGVGRLVGDDPSAPRAGTPRFVAPEVLAGADAGPRGDVYSLGALTLNVIAGRDADIASLPAPFARALEGALEPEPNMRCASAGALAVAFHDAVEEEIMRRRGPVRRMVDGLRLRSSRKAQTNNRVELPPTVTFPILRDEREASAFLDDPDRTQPLPPPADPYMAPMPSGVTQPLRPRE